MCVLYPSPRPHVYQSGEMQQEARRQVFTPHLFQSRGRGSVTTGQGQAVPDSPQVGVFPARWAGKLGVRCLCPWKQIAERPCLRSVTSHSQPDTNPCSRVWLPGPLWGRFRFCHQKALT